MKIMKKVSTPRSIAFSIPDSFMNTITVFRILPDNKTEAIGKIYPDTSASEDSIMYVSTNLSGEQLCPPSSDFTDIENHFERYADELSETAFIDAMEAKAEKFEIAKARRTSIKDIRYWKSKELEHNQITK
jgi:hypothetical protein